MPPRLALAAMLLVLAFAPAHAAEDTRKISVVGEAEISAPPDIARLTTGIVSDADTASAAVRANSEAVSAMIEALEGAGIAARDLQTANFSVQPRYVYPQDGQGEPRLAGYRATNSVAVTVRALGDLGRTLDAVVEAGANEITGLAFDIDDKTAITDRARAEAVKDARRKAEIYAEAAGASLGEVLSIDERTTQMPPPMPYRAMAMEARADKSVPIESGEQTIRVEVGVTWTIAGE